MSNKEQTTSLLSSPIKYAGGKSWLIPKMRSLYAAHKHRRFLDPFCGSCALPLALAPEQVLICDANVHLINFWQWIKDNANFTIAMINDELFYYNYRKLFNLTEDLTTKAELFYYLNRTCYNGLSRFSKKGNFNTPFGKYKVINYKDNLLEYKEAIAVWEIKPQPFTETIEKDLKSDDFVYIDPPYHETFTSYSQAGFTIHDQVILADLISSHTAPIVVSNAATPEMIKLYEERGFNVELVEVARRISCKGDRPKALEILATKNL